MSIRAVLFDLDGTLLNTLPDLWNITNITLRELGFPERSEEEVRSFVGNGMRLLIERALPENVPLTGEVYERMHANYLLYQNRLSVKYDGIDIMLSELRKAGIRLAVVSNKPDAAAQEVIRSYFPGVFEFVTGQRPDRQKKPHPDLCRMAMECLQVAPEECVYVGDSDTDLETGRNAGMVTLGCTWGFRGEEFLRKHGAEHLVRTPGEILKFM